jgi:hypothetical protein
LSLSDVEHKKSPICISKVPSSDGLVPFRATGIPNLNLDTHILIDVNLLQNEIDSDCRGTLAENPSHVSLYNIGLAYPHIATKNDWSKEDSYL